ncbi:Rrf2 family transcriptional regulator [Knoellia sp. S7-12]|uniref:RrF2 family transcriptional regulator n=1 Tax=Knoellia sp. S7-12 TaxID=3126698 RepID=UPI0033696D50
MNEGVEWALHTCVNLCWIPGQSVTAARLAAFYDLPTAYLNKQLQALARAGILMSTTGPRGGFQLARPPEKITLLDVVVAIDGPEDAFRCQEILRSGPGGQARTNYRKTCLISHSMRQAEMTWRKELSSQSIADIVQSVEHSFPKTPEDTRHWFDTIRT